MRLVTAEELLRSLERIKLYTKAAHAHMSVSVPTRDMENVLSLIPDSKKSGLHTSRVEKWLALHGIKLSDIPMDQPPRLQWDSLNNLWFFEVTVIQRTAEGHPIVTNGNIQLEMRVLPAPDFHI